MKSKKGKMITKMKPKVKVEISDEWKDDINKELEGIIYTGKERIDQITRFYDGIIRSMDSETETLELAFFQNLKDDLARFPPEAIGASWRSNLDSRLTDNSFRRQWKSFIFRIKYFPNNLRFWGFQKSVAYIFTFKKRTPFSIIGSLGEYYKDKAYDPTISEAFDTGFYTAVKLILDERISLDDIKNNSS